MKPTIVKSLERFRRDDLTLAVLCIFIALQLPYKLAHVPPFWYDEGWVASVSQNWAKQRHYGLLLAGEPVPASRLSTSLPGVAPIALSFRLLGVGVPQARLPGAVFTAGALAVLWLLARRLYDRSVATGALVAALFLPVLPRLHPVVMGRQALGEMPSLFYLLIGLLCLQRAWASPQRFLPLAVVFWALSLQTKPQVLPFLMAALLLPLGLLLWKRCFRESGILASGLLGAVVTSVALGRLWCVVLRGGDSAASPADNGFSFVAASPAGHLFKVFQLDPGVRIAALLLVVLTSVPLLLALCYAGWQFARDLGQIDPGKERLMGRMVLWTLTASWFAWYLLLSMGWKRYLFPAAFLGSVFIAALLDRITAGFSVASWKRRRAAQGQGGSAISRVGTVTILLAVLVAFLLTLVGTYADSILAGSTSALEETAGFLNTRTTAASLIETYDSELFILLERSYHFPPIEVEHQLIRRQGLGESVTIDYDPLAADINYLVVGPMSRSWELYEPVLETGAFRLVYENERYEVYERLREDRVGSQSAE